MKRILILLLSVCTLVSTLMLTSCGTPKVEDIYDRVVELVEGANELNTVFYGVGLPVYPTDSEYANLTKMYYNFEHEGSYEMVTPYSKFASVDQIKEMAEKIYSKAYLEEVVYPTLFTGHAVQGINDVQVSAARYMEDQTWIYQSVEDSTLYTGMIVYDYSTMKVVRPSKKDSCYVTMNAWMENTPDKVTEIRLKLVLQDGNWYLDAFTGGAV